MALDLYIYYRVRSEHAEQLRLRAMAMQRLLSQEYGIVSALKRRPEEKNGLQTWMEVYLATPEGFDDTLADAIVQARLPELIDGLRNMEYFLDASRCA